ncbi:hypothetical protein FF1_019624 [Malus domestica]|uniref:Uncharacterized protein n=1 Tax=Malus domestica TaxID=3750 RepID=A0A498HW45_MALDO|nr:hypothetical protein DVH24_042615 [Malus domestica]
MRQLTSLVKRGGCPSEGVHVYVYIRKVNKMCFKRQRSLTIAEQKAIEKMMKERREKKEKEDAARRNKVRQMREAREKEVRDKKNAQHQLYMKGEEKKNIEREIAALRRKVTT